MAPDGDSGLSEKINVYLGERTPRCRTYIKKRILMNHHRLCFLLLLALTLTGIQSSYSKSTEIGLSEKVTFKKGDRFKLKSEEFSVEIGSDPGTHCAVPGFNCGSGYRPPRPTFKTECGTHKVCPYIIMSDIRGSETGFLTIESAESCEKSNPEQCYFSFGRHYKSDDGCMNLKTDLGKYYCLKAYEKSKRPENKTLCDRLPKDVYGLRGNCFYEYAVRYLDVSFCDKYEPSELSGRDRCLLHMAELLKDKSLCKKISASKEHSYVELCRQIKE